MDIMEKITLVPQSGSAVQLNLNSVKKPYLVEAVLEAHAKVYSDMVYFIRIETHKEISDISVYINREKVDTDYRDEAVYFCNENRLPFLYIIGLAQITLEIVYANGDTEWLYSDFVSVLIKSTDVNEALDMMLKYVYENQTDILRRDMKITEISEKLDESYDDFWSQILLLEEIANVYEISYGYFMANCRYKLEKVEALDRVEKLQEVDSKTIQYITQHPEYLKSSVSGIKHGRQCFLPSKTLMMQKKITNDIYENQVVVSFLEHVLDGLHVLFEKINEYLRLTRIENEVENGYIVSSYLLYVNARMILSEFAERLSKLEKQYQQLVMSYANILKVKRIQMVKRPEPSAIFMNVPQYNRIYICILRWFSKKGYDLIKERVMFNFINAPSIYEAYVLIKMINQIRDRGYELVESKTVTYPRQANWIYRNQNYNNTFIFKSEDAKITLYYEPIIYDEDRTNVNAIGIYRNNSVSLNRETEDERQGHYYVPDYVIKYEEGDKEQYLLCDAKFSRKEKVQYQLLPDLIYKYITSISPVYEKSEIKGLVVFYGINKENSIMESFYNRQIREGKRITPRVEMLPLSESLTCNEQDKNATEMLRGLIGYRK